MNGETTDLWEHFERLLPRLQKAGGPILVAGGYGLFLKQEWILRQATVPIIIPMERWVNAVPRATGDIDLILPLELIAGEAPNKEIMRALTHEGFEESRSLHGRRWQFFKNVGGAKPLAVEFHAPKPDEETSGLQATKFAVKHKPSLGDSGVHGRLNHEAVGSLLHPFAFEVNNLEIVVPNPVTWSIMKLTAAKDNWDKWQSSPRDIEDRRYYREAAVKHGGDVCRAVAMSTREEQDRSGELVAAMSETPAFAKAARIVDEFFVAGENWAREILAGRWQEEDLELLLSVLSSWYQAKP